MAATTVLVPAALPKRRRAETLRVSRHQSIGFKLGDSPIELLLNLEPRGLNEGSQKQSRWSVR